MVKRSSIQDVAARAGVSVATVSRAFQYPHRVAAKTRELVTEIARELHYTPNLQARSLRTARTQLIVTLVPDIANPFFSEIIRGVERVAKQHGYAVLLGDTQYEAGNEQRYADMVSSRQVDGILTFIHRVPTLRMQGRLPIVNACEPVDDATISSVTIDNRAAFYDGVKYLAALGHRHIGFIGGPSSTSRARRQGYLEAMAEMNLQVVPELCQESDYSIEAGARATDLILSYGLPITALACVSDQLAIGAMQAARARGILVPGDLSILGFDDIAFARYTDPPLSTVAQPREQIGKEAMLMLLQIIENPDVPVRKLALPTQLVIRGSTAPPKPQN